MYILYNNRGRHPPKGFQACCVLICDILVVKLKFNLHITKLLLLLLLLGRNIGGTIKLSDANFKLTSG